MVNNINSIKVATTIMIFLCILNLILVFFYNGIIFNLQGIKIRLAGVKNLDVFHFV